MSAKPVTPLRGEAAYRAEKKEIERRNEAASAAACRKRAQKEAKEIAETAKRERSEMKGLRGKIIS